MEQEHRAGRGLCWGLLLSIPLWMSVAGWAGML